jgi:mono/diheme cytochrome c family protein
MRKSLLAVACLAVISVALYSQASSQAAAPQAPATGAPQAANAASQKQLLDKYCVACHSTKAKAAGLDSSMRLTLDDVDLTDVDAHRERLEKVVRKLRAGMMPPPGMPRPDHETFEGLVTWLKDELDRTSTMYLAPPGLHRLNRTEYANAIYDLLNLTIDPGVYLPTDDSTAGFDNIAGALGLSSTLVEAYVSAAQKISRLALGKVDSPGLVIFRAPEDTNQNYHIEGLPFGTRGGMLVEHLFPADGEYQLTITPIFGDNMSPTGFGSVPCERIEVSLDGERLALMDWRGGGRQDAARCRGEVREEVRSGQAGVDEIFAGGMKVRFKATAGLHKIGATYLETNFAPVLDLDKQFVRPTIQTGPTPGYTFFPHVGTLRLEGPFNAEIPERSPSRDKVFICQPANAGEEAACARRILTNLATTAYRRPVAASEVDELLAFYEEGRKAKNDFEAGIEVALARILASPQFIYRIEEVPANLRTVQNQPATRTYRISDLDLASRLSYFLWSRGPDEQLLKLASSGRLKDPAVLEQQVQRMLEDPRSEALTANFAGQWLNLRGLDAHKPIAMIYPNFDDALRQAMKREVELLFDSIVRDDRSVLDLLTADYTFVNERLAKHYGIPNITGSQFRRITLGPDKEVYHGLLGKGAILVTTAKPERTSPVTRGKWIMTNILGMSPPDPPPNVPPLPEKGAEGGDVREPSMRKKMEDHRVRADCTQCHRLMDPIGFSLENFDGIALWRTQDEDYPVDPVAVLFDNTKVDGPVALRNWIVNNYSQTFIEVVAEKLLTYGLGRGVEYRDMPVVRAIAKEATANGNRFSALVLAVVKSQPFQMNSVVEDAAPASRTASR